MEDDEALAQFSRLVADLKAKGPLELKPDRQNPLLYTTVVGAQRIYELKVLVSSMLGQPYKPSGESAMWKNWFDPFVKSVGGIEKQQTLYRRGLDEPFALYAAFWPWASDNTRCSLRIGLSCTDSPRRVELENKVRG